MAAGVYAKTGPVLIVLLDVFRFTGLVHPLSPPPPPPPPNLLVGFFMANNGLWSRVIQLTFNKSGAIAHQRKFVGFIYLCTCVCVYMLWMCFRVFFCVCLHVAFQGLKVCD